MTVSASSYAPLLHNGNDSTTAFSVTFQFYTLLVTHIDSSGSETVWVENTQYTVSGGDGSTGTVNVKTTPTDYTPASGEQLRIERATSQAQTEDFDFDNQVQEDSIQSSVDRNYMIMQELTYNNNRRPALSKSDYATLGALQFPAASANKAIGWNSDGDALVNIAQVDLDGVAITALTTTTSLENADLFPLYDDSAGDNAAITFANLKTSLSLGALAALDTVGTAQIDANAITTVKITDANITAAKLASNSVTTAKILDNNVTADKIADGVVGSIQYEQVVETIYTTQSTLSSVSSWTDTGLSASITPTASDSVVEIDFSAMINSNHSSGTNGFGDLRIVRDDSGITAVVTGIGRAQYFPSAEVGTPNNAGSVTDSPASTNALTYKLQIQPRSGTANYFVNRSYISTTLDVFACTMRLKERLA